MKTRIAVIFVILTFFLTGCGKKTLDSSLSVRLDSAVTVAVERGDVPGAVLCVSTPEGSYAKAYGYRGVFGRREPMTEDMISDGLFDLASLSKPVGIGLAVLRLAEEGRLDLRAKVSSYQPEYEGEATITDLLTHTSGLPAYAQWKAVANSDIPNMLCDDAERLYRRSAMEDYVCHCPRLAEPGTEYRYSCLNFITLQYIVEQVTCMPLDEYTECYVFKPLGMTHTGYRGLYERCSLRPGRLIPTEAVPLTAVSGIVGDDLFMQHDSVCLQGVVHDPLAREMNSGVSGNAGVFSTAADLCMLGEWMTGRRVVEDTVMTAVQRRALFFEVPKGYEAFGRTLAWGIWDDKSSPIICHTGYTGTYMMVDKAGGIVLILLTNRVHPHDGGAVAQLRQEVAEIMYKR